MTTTGPQNPAFCNYCPGICCYRLPGATLYLDSDDINRIARHFGIGDGEVRRRFIEGKNTFRVKDDNSCIFLGDGLYSKRCTIHPARPRQCREFPYGTSCPYLEGGELLAEIMPRVERSMGRQP